MFRLNLASSIFIGVMFSMTTTMAVESLEHSGPAHVQHIAKETAFNTITLTPKAEQHLDIKTIAIKRRLVPHTRLYGGELILPLNQSLSGRKKSLAGDQQSVFTILPLMTPADQIQVAEAQVNADGQVEAAKVQVEAAQVVLKRAQRLFRDHAGSQRAVDEAKAQVQLAQATLAEARARRQLLGPLLLSTSIPDRFWVRVSVYVGALNELSLQQSVHVNSLGNINRSSGFVANPVSGPPSANPNAATIDLFYEVDNPKAEWRLGQKVEVLLPLKQSGESLVVPWSAVVLDIYGGTWVYEKTAPHTYVRNRVQVGFLSGSEAVLASGPAPGTEIVIQGAAELFGTEVGFSK